MILLQCTFIILTTYLYYSLMHRFGNLPDYGNQIVVFLMGDTSKVFIWQSETLIRIVTTCSTLASKCLVLYNCVISLIHLFKYIPMDLFPFKTKGYSIEETNKTIYAILMVQWNVLLILFQMHVTCWFLIIG